jgi:hypothetical protein
MSAGRQVGVAGCVAGIPWGVFCLQQTLDGKLCAVKRQRPCPLTQVQQLCPAQLLLARASHCAVTFLRSGAVYC